VRRIVGLGLLLLLIYHSLGYVLVFVSTQWQEQHDLSKHLVVYRSVDSLVEFQIPINDKTKATELVEATTGGFGYRGHYYDVVSLHIQHDTLLIAGLETNGRSFWTSDLLTFLHDHLTNSDTANRKASQLLKLLLKEYSLTPQLVLHSLRFGWRDAVHLPAPVFIFSSRSLPVYSPPPESHRA
jgi:mRNA-degrading endonuclease YafQ of YafQ-DinJ toxin-antitoxin module